MTPFSMTRRQVLNAGGLAALGGLGACDRPEPGYDAIAAALSEPAAPALMAYPDQYRRLVHYAALAANGHNTQPWKFMLRPGGIDILPDLTRRTPVVDPDDHHLWASLGCAAENLVIAAAASGLAATVQVEETRVAIALAPAPATDSPLFAAIPRRQSCRAVYDGRAVPAEVMRRLEAETAHLGVDLVFLSGATQKEGALDFIQQGNSAQIADAGFVRELKEWIRFNEVAAARTRDGLFSRASGNPSVPTALGRMLFGSVFTAKGENEKYAEQVRSSAFLVTFIAPQDTPAGWVQAGRACQRFALAATAEGIAGAFLNQPVEVAAIRPRFADFIGAPGRRPDIIMRFGYGPQMPRALRRPLGDIIVA